MYGGVGEERERAAGWRACPRSTRLRSRRVLVWGQNLSSPTQSSFQPGTAVRLSARTEQQCRLSPTSQASTSISPSNGPVSTMPLKADSRQQQRTGQDRASRLKGRDLHKEHGWAKAEQGKKASKETSEQGNKRASKLRRRSRVFELPTSLQVQGIPSLVLLDAHTGEVINGDADSELMGNPTGMASHQKQVSSLSHLSPPCDVATDLDHAPTAAQLGPWGTDIATRDSDGCEWLVHRSGAAGGRV